MTESLFKPLDGIVVLSSNGSYKESSLVELDGSVFAKHVSGFIRLKENGRTSHPKVFWNSLRTNADLTTYMGNMILDSAHPQKKNPEAA